MADLSHQYLLPPRIHDVSHLVHGHIQDRAVDPDPCPPQADRKDCIGGFNSEFWSAPCYLCNVLTLTARSETETVEVCKTEAPSEFYTTDVCKTVASTEFYTVEACRSEVSTEFITAEKCKTETETEFVTADICECERSTQFETASVCRTIPSEASMPRSLAVDLPT